MSECGVDEDVEAVKNLKNIVTGRKTNVFNQLNLKYFMRRLYFPMPSENEWKSMKVDIL